MGIYKIYFGYMLLGMAGIQNAYSVDNPKNRPNIIFIMADDLGCSDLGCMGSDFYETPNIDRLAAEGLLFDCAYAAAANSAPSRACFITGLPEFGINLE